MDFFFLNDDFVVFPVEANLFVVFVVFGRNMVVESFDDLNAGEHFVFLERSIDVFKNPSI